MATPRKVGADMNQNLLSTQELLNQSFDANLGKQLHLPLAINESSGNMTTLLTDASGNLKVVDAGGGGGGGSGVVIQGARDDDSGGTAENWWMQLRDASDNNIGSALWSSNTLAVAAQRGLEVSSLTYAFDNSLTVARRVACNPSGELEVVIQNATLAVTQSTSPWTVAGTVAATQGTDPWVVEGSYVDGGTIPSGGGMGIPWLVKDNAETGWAIPKVNASGELVVTTAGGGSGGTSVTEYAEDTPHTTGDSGIFPLGVRNDNAGTILSGTDGDYTPIAVDSRGRVLIRPLTTSAPYVDVVGAEQSGAWLVNVGTRAWSLDSSTDSVEAEQATAGALNARAHMYFGNALAYWDGSALNQSSTSSPGSLAAGYTLSMMWAHFPDLIQGTFSHQYGQLTAETFANPTGGLGGTWNDTDRFLHVMPTHKHREVAILWDGASSDVFNGTDTTAVSQTIACKGFTKLGFGYRLQVSGTGAHQIKIQLQAKTSSASNWYDVDTKFWPRVEHEDTEGGGYFWLWDNELCAHSIRFNITTSGTSGSLTYTISESYVELQA